MRKKLIHSQLSNDATFLMYLRQMETLAENVFEFQNMPDFIDIPFLNKTLVRDGSIAFFKDDVLGLLALPYVNQGLLDVYDRPLNIQVHSPSGYIKDLKQGEFVIMYDNNGRYPIYLDILQYSERLAMFQRVMDINIAQQKTPRFWKTKSEKEKSIRDMINNVDGFENLVITYEDIDLDDTTLVMQPAPYISDKVDLNKDKIYNEFLRLIGIANLSFQKKERNIKDEVQAMQGGTIASRFSRYEPRKKAIDMINKKFNLDIKVKYYDGIPSSLKDFEDEENEMEVTENDDAV